LDGKDLTYNMIQDYLLTGTISGKTMSGTYPWAGVEAGYKTWSAVLIEE
jgi:hypothetical protein